jgi:cysteine desulfurase
VRLFACDGCPGEAVVAALDARGFAVSTGTACTSGARTPPDVLIAAGRDRRSAARAVRVSVGRATRDDDVGRLVDALADVLPLVAAAALESEKT